MVFNIFLSLFYINYNCCYEQEDKKQWKELRNAYGAVWHMANPPRGSLNLRLQATSGYLKKWVTLTNVIRKHWKAGVVYDSDIQLS